MSSILIFGGDTKGREARLFEILAGLNLEISENNPDLIFIEPEEDRKTIGIGQVREGMKFLNEKPLNHKLKAAVVKRAQILTEQAQTAMLKALEEHQPYANIILCSKTENDLLPTVISRCRRIAVRMEKPAESVSVPIADILAQNLGERLAWVVENLPETKEELIELLETWMGELRADLTLKNAQNIEEIITVKHDLENTNVTAKLALENLLLKL